MTDLQTDDDLSIIWIDFNLIYKFLKLFSISSFSFSFWTIKMFGIIRFVWYLRKTSVWGRRESHWHAACLNRDVTWIEVLLIFLFHFIKNLETLLILFNHSLSRFNHSINLWSIKPLWNFRKVQTILELMELFAQRFVHVYCFDQFFLGLVLLLFNQLNDFNFINQTLSSIV